MKSFVLLILIMIFASPTYAQSDAAQTLKNFYESASEPADITDIDLLNASTDRPQKCAYATVGYGAPAKMNLKRVETKFEIEDFGPLFSGVDKNLNTILDLNFNNTTDFTESQLAEVAQNLVVSKTKYDLVFNYTDPRYRNKNIVKIRRHEKNLAIFFQLNDSSIYYGYCFRR
jgi:hypothetical protein